MTSTETLDRPQDEADEIDETPLERFRKNVLGSPWGSMSRSELDFQIFLLLVDEGVISLVSSDFELCGTLFTTVARVRALRFRYQQRSAPKNPKIVQELLVPKNLAFGKAAKDGQIKVSIFDPYLKGYLLQRLEQKRAIAQETLTASMVEVNVKSLLDVLFDAFEAIPEASKTTDEARALIYKELRREVKGGKNARALQTLSTVPVVIATSDGALSIIHSILTNSN